MIADSYRCGHLSSHRRLIAAERVNRIGSTSAPAMSAVLRWTIGAVLLTGPVSANAAAITYSFTGTVTAATGMYSSIAIGSSVDGTYTIDLSHAIASASILPVSQTAVWMSREWSGQTFGLPANDAYVFSMTATVAGTSYSTSPIPGAFQSLSDAIGEPGGQSLYFLDELNYSTTQHSTESQVLLSQYGTTPWSNDGLPIFSATVTGTGYFDSWTSGATSEVDYTITSLTAPVPLPAAGWLLLSALGGIGFVGRKGQSY